MINTTGKWSYCWANLWSSVAPKLTTTSRSSQLISYKPLYINWLLHDVVPNFQMNFIMWRGKWSEINCHRMILKLWHSPFKSSNQWTAILAVKLNWYNYFYYPVLPCSSMQASCILASGKGVLLICYLKWNPNNVHPTCKAIRRLVYQRSVVLRKKSKKVNWRSDNFSLLCFGYSQVYWFYI